MRALRRRSPGWFVVLGLGTLLGAPQARALEKNKHPFFKRGPETMDLVVSLDWDPNDGKTFWDKPRMTRVFKRFASKAAGLTDGRVRICNLYVFPEMQQVERADIRIEQTPEGQKPKRAHGGRGGIINGNGNIQAYTSRYTTADAESGNALPEEQLGDALTHELGHYAFGVLDEYRENDPSKMNRPEPGSPRGSDVSLVTIMGMPYEADALSAPADYDKQVKDHSGKFVDPKLHTAQYRFWRMSAWELITFQQELLPLAPKLEASGDRPEWVSLIGSKIPDSPVGNPGPRWDECLGIHFMEGKAVTLVFDNSGSTIAVPDSKGKTVLDYEKEHARAFIESLKKGDRLQVWGLGTHTPLLAMTPITSDAASDPAKQQAIAAIEAINADNGLATWDADYTTPFSHALDVLTGEQTRKDHFGARRYVLVITDGRDNISTDAMLAKLEQHSVPVFTLGVKATDLSYSKRMAQTTHGMAWHDQYVSGGVLYAEIDRFLRTHQTLGWEAFKQPAAEAPSDFPAHISDLDREARFSASWNVGDSAGFSLRSPSGVVIDRDQLPPNVSFVDYGEGGQFVVTDPEPGVWTSSVTHSSQGSWPMTWQEVAVDTPLAVSVQARASGYPMPVLIEAEVRAPEAVIGAKLSASVEVPEGSPPADPIALVDDGTGADATASDGVYTGVLPTLAEGKHVIRVTADNPDGSAFVLASAGDDHDDGSIEPTSPVPLPEFRREAVTEYEEGPIEPAPSSPELAEAAGVNKGETWGALEPEAPVHWYSLLPYAGNHYYIMTGRLWATDGQRMVTRVKLVEEDGTTVIAESSDFEGSGTSFIHWKAPDRKLRYVVVEHANGGSGRYALSVSNWDRRLESFGQKPSESGGGGGCSTRSGRPSAGWLGLGVLLAWVSRRRRQRAAGQRVTTRTSSS